MNVHLHDGLDVVSACRKAGISDKTYYYWRKKFGGLGRPQLSEMKALKKENERLKKIVADLQLDKLILKESLDYLERVLFYWIQNLIGKAFNRRKNAGLSCFRLNQTCSKSGNCTR